MAKLSVYIVAYNEETKIQAALESVAWASEIVVADSGSTDRTVELTERFGARVVQIPFEGFGNLRNRTVEACSHEWIFSLDADERCTEQVRDEIREIIADPDALDAYFVPRRNYFLGRWIRHSGWYPDYRQPQLFRKGTLRYREDLVHEGFIAGGRIGYLNHAIWQFPFQDLSEVVSKMQRYSSLGAEKLAGQGVKSGMGKAFVHALGAFIRIYIIKGGFLDGWAGFVIALGNFEGTFYRYAKLTVAQKMWNVP
ncbi:MAG: glycosyltransferase family 2 protein, partial [Candidatus Binatia bacterium]